MRLAAASSSRNANDLLSRISLGDPPVALIDVFEANVCGRRIPLGKPYPDIFLTAAAELGVNPSACLVIEDATAGVLAAKAGGMRALGVARHGDAALLRSAGADLVVSSLDEIDMGALSRGELSLRREAA
jgi:beta-phosphoglucomutase-like phosphatase (HAD superfamily)